MNTATTPTHTAITIPAPPGYAALVEAYDTAGELCAALLVAVKEDASSKDREPIVRQLRAALERAGCSEKVMARVARVDPDMGALTQLVSVLIDEEV
jgi:hypothetical protein